METKEILLNAYLDLSHEGSNLRDMAYAKAIMWVLYAENKPLNSSIITKNISQLVDSNSIPESAIKSALELLKIKKLIIPKDESWELSPNEKSAMLRQIQHSTEVTERIIKKRFPNQIDKVKLKNWFDESNSNYFGVGAEKLISLYTDRQKLIFNVESIIRQVIKNTLWHSY